MMLRFLFKSIVFLLPLLVLLGLIEFRLRSAPNGYTIKRNYLERRIADTEVVVTGSSHAFFSIKPELLGVPAFSTAYVSQDIYYDTRILLKYLPQAQNTKLVIVPISYFAFGYELENSVEAWRTSYYYRFWDIPHVSSKLRLEDYLFIAMYGIPKTRGFLLEGFPDARGEHINESGGSTRPRFTNRSSVMNAGPTLSRHNSGYNEKYSARNEQYLIEMFDALKARGISAVIVTPPCFKSYYENMDPEIYRLMQARIESLRQKYQLEYFNYLADSRFTIEDFSDSDHLSTRGAEKFSLILRDEVIRKYVR